MTTSQSLYLKWRPAQFDGVVGQQHVVQTLLNALRAGRPSHAYLFAGPRGTGKTSVARLLAKALNCTNADAAQRPCGACPPCQAVTEGRFLDLIEIDAASNNSVEHVRDLRDKINFSPSIGRYKVYIIDEVHMLSDAAFNALLKTLEEPPPYAIFVLATTEAHKVPATVASRCQQHIFRRIALPEMVERLKEITGAEGLTVEPAVLELVARQATGSLRDAISLLDQLVASTQGALTLQQAQSVVGSANEQLLAALVLALADDRTAAGLDLINEAMDQGTDPRQFARQIVDYLRGVMLCKVGHAQGTAAQHASDTTATMQALAARFDLAQLTGAMRAFDEAGRERRGGWLAQLPLELALLNWRSYAAGAHAPAVPAAAARPAAAGPKPAAAPPLVKPVIAAQPQSAVKAPVPEPAVVAAEVPEVSRHWPVVLQNCKALHHSMPALLEYCSPLRIDGDTLLLGVTTAFAHQKLDTEEMRERMREAVLRATGHTLKMRFVQSAAHGAELPADVATDGVVAAAVKLGARARERGR
ncbi:MAG: DNA polymerase III subunit gamma/tau [Chloroflexi bacterium]|nr:MAG: DNA polymerase III subunit gamma/tau [Chloroflexota bacterium]